jgi:hypothetical protein
MELERRTGGLLFSLSVQVECPGGASVVAIVDNICFDGFQSLIRLATRNPGSKGYAYLLCYGAKTRASFGARICLVILLGDILMRWLKSMTRSAHFYVRKSRRKNGS